VTDWALNNLARTLAGELRLGTPGRIATPEYWLFENRDWNRYVVGSLEPGAPWPVLGIPDGAITLGPEGIVNTLVPAAPAIAAISAGLDGDYTIGWNASATGATLAEGDQFTFYLDPDSAGVFVGVSLAANAPITDPAMMLLAVYAASGKYIVYANGKAKTAPAAFAYGDQWTVIRGADRVVLLLDGAPVYGVEVAEDVTADVCLFVPMDRVYDAAPGTGTAPTEGYTLFEPEAQEPGTGTGGGTMQVLATGSDAAAGEDWNSGFPSAGGGTFAALTASGSDFVAPNYAIGMLYTPLVGAWGLGEYTKENDGGDMSLAPLTAGGDERERPIGVCNIEVIAIGFAYPTPNTFAAKLPRIRCDASMTVRKLTTLSERVPVPGLTMRLGARARGKVPVPTLDASLQTSGVMRLDETIGYA
jgi:hypothetical protein